ncbi:hypothetical protein ACFW6F_26545 [Streptomyces sp. NPDC058746]|uniref:hypothetical protein n=1 Tax=Streptomyces sp. NPDC058746 TaxID=3346622 RepID=UPI00369A13F0
MGNNAWMRGASPAGVPCSEDAHQYDDQGRPGDEDGAEVDGEGLCAGVRMPVPGKGASTDVVIVEDWVTTVTPVTDAMAKYALRPTALIRTSRALPAMGSLSSFPGQRSATRISPAPITMVNSGPGVLLTCEVAWNTACSTGLVASPDQPCGGAVGLDSAGHETLPIAGPWSSERAPASQRGPFQWSCRAG